MTNTAGSLGIQVKYLLDNKSLGLVTNSINKIKSQSSSVQSAFTSAFGKIGAAITAAFSVAAITKFINTCNAAYKVQFMAETKLTTVMRQRMHATNAEIQAIKDLASEYQNLGVIGDEVGLTGIAQLATFAKQAQSLKTILPAFENALVGMYGLDVSTSQATQFANQLGKALANGNLSALTRSGMTFTDAEQSAFKLANELERAEILAGALEQNYGKMNEVVGQTPLGQIKRLSNYFADVLEKFGQAFVNIGSLFVPILMKVVGFLDLVASVIAKVSEAFVRLFGGKYIKNIGVSASEGADGLSDLASGYDEVGSAAKKASESLASFDNVIQLSDTSSSGSGSGGIGDSSVGSVGGIIEEELADSQVDGIIEKIKKIPQLLKKAFESTSIDEDFRSIGNSLVEIFEGLRPSAENFIKSFANYLITGGISLTGVAISVAESIVGGFALYLEQNKGRISEQFSSIYDNCAGWSDNMALLLYDLGGILSNFFSLETTKQAIANALGAVEGAITGTYLIITGLYEEISMFISKTIDDNFAGLNAFCENTSALLSQLTSTIKTIIQDCFSSIYDTFEQYVRPAFEQFQEGFSYAFGKVIEFWNQSIFPLLNTIAVMFDNLWTQHLKPFVDQVLGMVGAFIEAVTSIYNFAIKPYMAYMDELWVGLSMILGFIVGAFEGSIGSIIDLFSGLAQFLKGVFEVIAGVFQGDGQKVCDGLVDIFKGLLNSIITIFTHVVNTIISAVNGVIRTINKIEIPGTEIGVNIKEIPKWKPQLADGGIVYRPTDFGDFVAGEAGAEAIVPLENSGYTRTLAQEIVKGMLEAGMGGDTYNINAAYMDRKGLERLTQDINGVNKQISARKGVVSYA